MEEEIKKLREDVKNNSNLSDAFKANVGILTDTLVNTYPDYNYYKLGEILSTLNISSDNALDSYSSYNRETNNLSINLDKIFEDRIDMQHLFLNDMLEMPNKVNTGYESFNRGITEVISSTMNSDDSMKKLNPQEFVLMSIFTKIVDPSVLESAYMKGSIADIIIHLESMGIDKQQFDELCTSFANLKTDGTSFANAEVNMVNMYSTKLNIAISNGVCTFEDIKPLFENFEEMLILNRNELIALYPHHDFSKLSGFEKVKEAIEFAVVKLEDVKTEEKTK